MENNVSFKGRIIWQANGLFHAIGGLHADTLDGIKKLIEDKIKKEMENIKK